MLEPLLEQGQRCVFACNQSEISPLSTTHVGVASQLFAVAVDDVQANGTANAAPQKIPSHPVYLLQIIIQICHSRFCFYLFGNGKHN